MPSSYLNSAGNLRWKANWRDADGQQHSRNFDDEDAAAGFERERIAEREAANPSLCKRCGAPFEQTGVGRRRVYCEPCREVADREATVASHRRLRQERPRERPAVECAWCGEPVEQPTSGRPRKFCKGTKCGQHFHNAQKGINAGARDGQPQHTMTNVDPITQIGTCAVHGPDTPAYRSSRDGEVRWRCKHRVQAQQSVRNAPRIGDLDGRAKVQAQVAKMQTRGLDITVERWLALKDAAAGHCQLCGREAELHTDHCHDTRRVRGLLCSTCNTGLGKLGDGDALMLVKAIVYAAQDASDIRRAIEYLENHATVV